MSPAEFSALVRSELETRDRARSLHLFHAPRQAEIDDAFVAAVTAAASMIVAPPAPSTAGRPKPQKTGASK